MKDDAFKGRTEGGAREALFRSPTTLLFSAELEKFDKLVPTLIMTINIA